MPRKVIIGQGIRQKHGLTHQLFIQSAPFYQSLYQFLFRRHYAVFFLRCWDRSFRGRHDGCNAACRPKCMSGSGPPIEYAARVLHVIVLRKRDARPITARSSIYGCRCSSSCPHSLLQRTQIIMANQTTRTSQSLKTRRVHKRKSPKWTQHPTNPQRRPGKISLRKSWN